MKKIVLVFILFIILILALYANVLFGKRPEMNDSHINGNVKTEQVEETNAISD